MYKMSRYNFTAGPSPTLQQAFNAGNTISLDDGPIVLSSTDGSPLLATNGQNIIASTLLDSVNTFATLTNFSYQEEVFGQISCDGPQMGTTSVQIVYPLTMQAAFNYDVQGFIFVFGSAGPMLIEFFYGAVKPELLAPATRVRASNNPNYTATISYTPGPSSLTQTVTFSDTSLKFVDYSYTSQSYFP